MHSVIVTDSGPYYAISYQSPTFEDLNFFMNQAGKSVIRIDPDKFLGLEHCNNGQYINLITRFPLRQKISEKMDSIHADRFSVFANCFVPSSERVGKGCFLYPGVSIYPSTEIDQDVIIHANTLIAHGTQIGRGCFISGLVCIAGSVHIGEYCWLGVRTTVSDNVSLAKNTHTVIASTVVDNIIEPNTIYKKHLR